MVMDLPVTTFTNPYSFFCKEVKNEDGSPDLSLLYSNNHTTLSQTNLSDVNHGQYVAIMCDNKWLRGIVSMESQLLIWLVDYGVYIRPTDRTVHIDLPPEYRKLATKVFEASIHGVIPMAMELGYDCHLKNEKATTWDKGAVKQAKELIESAQRTFFVPVALMTTTKNDIVIGDLYLNLPGKGFVNIIDELELWPVHLQINKEAYVEGLSNNYVTRRKHRACVLKPDFPELPVMTPQTTVDEYNAICERSPQFEANLDNFTEVGSTVVLKNINKKNKSPYILKPEEYETYSQRISMVNGREINMLHALVNKMRDLKMCMDYQNHDLKSIGRANVHRKLKKVRDLDFGE